MFYITFKYKYVFFFVISFIVNQNTKKIQLKNTTKK